MAGFEWFPQFRSSEPRSRVFSPTGVLADSQSEKDRERPSNELRLLMQTRHE